MLLRLQTFIAIVPSKTMAPGKCLWRPKLGETIEDP